MIEIDKETASLAYDALVRVMRLSKPVADAYGGPHREIYLDMQQAANALAAAILKEKVTHADR